jgi:hypothetical protein
MSIVSGNQGSRVPMSGPSEPEYVPPDEIPFQPPFTITVTDAEEREMEFVSGSLDYWFASDGETTSLSLEEVITRIRGIVNADSRGTDDSP